MNENPFGVIDKAIGAVLSEMPGQQRNLPSQAEVWASVRDDPNKLLGFVQARTGQSGDGLLREVTAYQQAMKERYG